MLFLSLSKQPAMLQRCNYKHYEQNASISKSKHVSRPRQICFQMPQLYQTLQLQLAFKPLLPTKGKQPQASGQVKAGYVLNDFERNKLIHQVHTYLEGSGTQKSRAKAGKRKENGNFPLKINSNCGIKINQQQHEDT